MTDTPPLADRTDRPARTERHIMTPTAPTPEPGTTSKAMEALAALMHAEGDPREAVLTALARVRGKGEPLKPAEFDWAGLTLIPREK